MEEDYGLQDLVRNKLIDENNIQLSLEQQINEQFLNDYIYKLSLFNPNLHRKISNLCSLSYLLASKMKLNADYISQAYWYASIYYIKDSKVIQLKMNNYCKQLNVINRIKESKIAYYTKDLIPLLIMACDNFLTLYDTYDLTQCIKIMRKDEILPQIFVDNLAKIDIQTLEKNIT